MISTEISLEMIDKKTEKDQCGEFKLAAPVIGVKRIFGFALQNPDEDSVHLVITKDGQPYVEQKGQLTREALSQYTPEQKIVLTAFTIIWRAYKGQLNELGIGKKAASIATPIPVDQVPNLRNACS